MLGGFVDTPVYRGDRLSAGHLIVGPAIIEHVGTTIVVYPDHEALIDQYENCVIEHNLTNTAPGQPGYTTVYQACGPQPPA